MKLYMHCMEKTHKMKHAYSISYVWQLDASDVSKTLV
jgi:hypothetical protein